VWHRAGADLSEFRGDGGCVVNRENVVEIGAGFAMQRIRAEPATIHIDSVELH
jgi:hypothetical protein